MTPPTFPVRPSSNSRVSRLYPIVARTWVGLMFLVMGLNGFLDFLPHPATMPANATAFMGGLMASGYIFPLISGVQLLVAILLLSNRFVPLALAVIAPVIVNIAAFHLFLSSMGAPLAALTILPYLYLVWIHGPAYRSMLVSRAPERTGFMSDSHVQ